MMRDHSFHHSNPDFPHFPLIHFDIVETSDDDNDLTSNHDDGPVPFDYEL